MPPKDLRASSSEVDQFVAMVMLLIDAAASYAESGQVDENNEGMIRRLRVAAGALQAALQNIQVAPRGIAGAAAMAARSAMPMPETKK